MNNSWRGKVWIYFSGSDGIDNAIPAFTITAEPNIQNSELCFGHTAINV